MRVTVVDPPAYTPPYDHALCAALARRGLDVELATSQFRYGGGARAARATGATECFYRLRAGQRGGEGAAASARHAAPGAAPAARRRAGVVHFQWLPIPALDRLLVRALPAAASC